MKYLVRDPRRKMLAGVLSGLGNYFDIDPTVLRIAYIAFTILSGFLPGILMYAFTALVMPLKAE